MCIVQIASSKSLSFHKSVLLGLNTQFTLVRLIICENLAIFIIIHHYVLVYDYRIEPLWCERDKYDLLSDANE